MGWRDGSSGAEHPHLDKLPSSKDDSVTSAAPAASQ
jgi:hypothetical protein